MGMTYTYEDAKYDVEKLSVEGQQVFKILAVAQRKADELNIDTTLAQAAVVAMHTKMQEYLSDKALIKEDE
jgi:hypothetical protein|tara:strand:- start:807 stop:1019 length:213 start_codon:yes stop_codon:yes gene_type:complete